MLEKLNNMQIRISTDFYTLLFLIQPVVFSLPTTGISVIAETPGPSLGRRQQKPLYYTDQHTT